MYQRLRPRRSASAADALRKTREARCDGKCVLEGNRLVDVKNLSSFLANKTACRPCATRAAVQLAFNFVGMLNADVAMATRHLSGPSYSNWLKRHLRQRGGHAAAVNIPSFAPVGKENQGFALTIHFECSGAVDSCNLKGNTQTTTAANGVTQVRSRFAVHRTLLSTSPRSSLCSQSRWPRHP